MNGEAMSEKRTAEHREFCGLMAKPCLKGAAGHRENLRSGGEAMPERGNGAQGENLYPDGGAMLEM